jgi:uncharacterized protein (TIGR03086 family)
MDVIELLDQGFDWTAQRVTLVRTEQLASSTPCSEWDLRHLLDHTLGSLSILTDAVSGEDMTSRFVTDARVGSDPAQAFADVVQRAMTTWHTAGVLEGTYAIPLGPTPGRVVANINLLEVVVHGWDIAQSTGEAEEIPPVLAEPILGFARELITDETRGVGFAPELAGGETASARLVSFLGRRP